MAERFDGNNVTHTFDTMEIRMKQVQSFTFDSDNIRFFILNNFSIEKREKFVIDCVGDFQ
ncbi:MAG: hypothetical protein STSR0009_28310 [Methanoregula sp.]